MRGLSSWVIAVWALAFALLILNAAVSIYNIDVLIESDRAVDHSRDVSGALGDLMSALKDAETGQRGFQITGRDEYLTPFATAKKTIPEHLDRLRQLTANDPFHSPRVAILTDLVATKMATLHDAIGFRRTAGPEAAWDRLVQAEGKDRMDQIRALAAEMERHEDDVLVHQSQIAESRYRSSRFTALLGGMLTVLMVAMAFALVRRELSRRQRAENDARRAAEEVAASQKATADTLALLDAFFANLPIGAAFFDLEQRYLRINEPLAASNGKPVEVHLGRRMLEAVPDMPRDVVNDLQTVAATGRPILNRRIVGRPGAPDRIWLTNFFPVRTAAGLPVGVGVVAQDVTERLAAENRLRESEAMYRAVFDTAVDGIITIDERANVETYNPAAERLFGYPAADVIGKNANILMPDTYGREHDEQIGQFWQHKLRPGAGGRQVEGRRQDGTTFPMELAVSETLVNGRRVFTEIVRDITERKRAEDALRNSLDRFRSLVEAVPQMVCVMDPSGALTQVNGRWIAYTGMSSAECRNLLVAVHPEDAPEAAERWWAALAHTPDRFTHECRLRSADGEYRWMLVAAVPLQAGDGSVLQWVATLTDVDDQKRQSEILAALVKMRTAELESANHLLREEIAERTRAESRAKAAAIELGRSNEDLERFAYVASHDLQEPLRKIQSFGDRLLKRYYDVLGEDGQEQVDRMKSAATRMRTLIEALLKFSRVSTRGQPFSAVDLNGVMKEALSDLELRISQTSGRVDVECLPQIEADPVQMRQLFQNLVGNALKFHKPGVPPVVSIQATEWGSLPQDAEPRPPSGRGYRIAVSDNGIGFDQAYSDRVFEVFQRLHGRGAYEGTGIGLAICRKIVQRHGGEINVRSRVGEGTVFFIDLPTFAGAVTSK
jgi:PAS domain S-box-containing protein